MRRRTKPAKAKVEAKPPVAHKSLKNEGSRVRDLEKRLAEALRREAEVLKREAEASEQQAATSEVLKVISRSTFDLQPVLDILIENATKLCDAPMGGIFRSDGEVLRLGAFYGASRELRKLVQRTEFHPGRESVLGRVALEHRMVHVLDVLADPEYHMVEHQRIGGFRTSLGIPMLREGVLIGAFFLWRTDVRAFTDKQIELVEAFADQAVIAIANARLLGELQTSNRELTTALNTQTATADILRVISSTPTDTQPVFNAIAESATTLLRGWSTTVLRLANNTLYVAATYGGLPGSADAMRTRFPGPVTQDEFLAETLLGPQVTVIEDVERDGSAMMREIARIRGWRANLAVPMLREGPPIGLISVTRVEPGPFAPGEIELMKTFADQAVIAVENVRLFTELQLKNEALTQAHAQVTEAFEQQTAASEILRVISSSPTDIQPVFDAIAHSAARLCEAFDVVVLRVQENVLHLVAHHGPLPVVADVPLHRRTLGGRTMIERRVIHILDLQAEVDEFPEGSAIAQAGGHRTTLSVPLLKEGVAIGNIQARRQEVRPFSDTQISLLTTFADQAVIAIENVRLFKELQTRTAELTRSVGELTGLGEVSQAISSTLDLETVLTTIVSRAVQLSGLDGGVVFEYDESAEEFVHRAATETGGALADARRATRVRKGEGVVGRTAITFEPAQVPDITVPGAHESRLRGNLIESGIRAVLAVPMVREGRLIGSLVVSRNRPGDFPAETIELLRTFATQSALAIQNARLFHEIADKSRQLEIASQHKSEFLANMSHELRTPLNAIIGFSEVLAQGMFGQINEKQTEYLHDILESGQHLLSLINDILDLSKIEAGRMELEAADFDLPNAIENALVLVRERAIRRGIRLGSTIDTRLGMISGDERKVKQVLLNLLSNALKFTPEGGQIDVAARLHDAVAEVSVADTGIGIAPTDQETVFEEFRQVGTADKKAEGTGLGLTLSRKFIELHGGRIWVTSQVGVGSTFTFTLPMHGDR